ncbi:MAG: right-handed parallel beta-helix repeat-containing protein, partial [Victivallales bacterium]
MNKIKLTVILLCAGICTLGAQDTVKASAFGFNPEDATTALQKAIDSGAQKVIVDNTGKDWITRPLFLRSNQEIIFEDGVTLRAKKGEFKGTNDSLININDISNVAIRGEGAVTLAMNKKDYDNPARYKFSEWRHAISIRGATNIKISDLTLKSSGGDGIYVARGKRLPYSKNITVDNVTSEDHYRQGISLISVENMVIRNSRFNSTRGTAPQCGIDFEPNHPGERFVNIVIDNCEFSKNASAGIMFHIPGLKENSKPVSVTIRNSKINSNQCGIIVTTKEVAGEIRFENCLIEENHGIPFLLNGQNEKGLKITLKDTTCRNLKYGLPSIVLAGENADIGNLILDYVKVIAQSPAPIEFNGMTGYGIVSLSGTLLYGK